MTTTTDYQIDDTPHTSDVTGELFVLGKDGGRYFSFQPAGGDGSQVYFASPAMSQMTLVGVGRARKLWSDLRTQGWTRVITTS